MRWFLMALLCLAGCGKSEPAKPSAADYQAELAELERLEKDLAGVQAESSRFLQTTFKADDAALAAGTSIKSEDRRKINDAMKILDAKVVAAQRAVDEQKTRVESMRKERRN